MADVPAWLLVINTALAGSFGIVGAGLVPRSQREARKQQARETAAAIMRAKAEELFEAIEQVRTDSRVAMIAAWRSIDQKDAGNVVAFPSLASLRALAATYYPGALRILDEYASKLLTIDNETPGRLLAAASATNPEQSIRADRLLSAEQYSGVLSSAADALTVHLIEAVRQYHPDRLGG